MMIARAPLASIQTMSVQGAIKKGSHISIEMVSSYRLE